MIMDVFVEEDLRRAEKTSVEDKERRTKGRDYTPTRTDRIDDALNAGLMKWWLHLWYMGFYA